MLAELCDASNGLPTAAHFIYIPGALLVGIVLGYVFGNRAARDAYAAEQRRTEARAARAAARREKDPPPSPPASD